MPQEDSDKSWRLSSGFSERERLIPDDPTDGGDINEIPDFARQSSAARSGRRRIRFILDACGSAFVAF